MKNVILRNVVAVGMHHHEPRSLEVGAVHTLEHDSSNCYDKNAIQVLREGRLVAYHVKQDAAVIVNLFSCNVVNGEIYAKPKTEAEVKQKKLGPQQLCSVGYKCNEVDIAAVQSIIRGTGWQVQIF